MRRAFGLVVSAALLALSLGSTSCGRPFDVETAPGFLALEHQDPYAWRATTTEGIVVGVRVIEDEQRGDLAFWTQAVTRALREGHGYALIEASDVTSRDGTKGKLLKFGHDEGRKPYAYWVTLFLAQGRIFVVEAGGEKAAFDLAKPSVDWMLKSVRVRCSSFLAPVLASHTCNRW